MKIVITGSNRLIVCALKSTDPRAHTLVYHTMKNGDLKDTEALKNFLRAQKPDCVLHLADRVGGNCAEFVSDINLWNEDTEINRSVLHACHACGVRKVVSCLPTCVFPDRTTCPIDESMIHDGPPHPSNEGCAYAARMLEVSSRLHSQQRNVTYTTVIPVNVFGPNDNFDTDGRVIPTLIRNSVAAKAARNHPPLSVKGSGHELRQFVYSKDLASLLLWACTSYNSTEPLILCDERENSIQHTAACVRDAVDQSQELVFDSKDSDGALKATFSNARLRKLLPGFEFTPLEDALRETCSWFEKSAQAGTGCVPSAALAHTRRAALITGVSGQDGSYLADFLLEKGYAVHGIVRRHCTIHLPNIEHVRNRITLHYGDVEDYANVTSILHGLRHYETVEVYNLAAMSHVKVSFDEPVHTLYASGASVLNVLECIRNCGFGSRVKCYQASTSEMFGDVVETPQNEDTPFRPCSPYACAKVYGHYICKNYRESYGMFVSCGILFNHESRRRGPTFVTQKICDGVKRIRDGKAESFEIGNLDSLRDWGHAQEYVEAMWLMLQRDVPDDYVVATGEMHTVREFVEAAFGTIGMTLAWEMHNGLERGVDESGTTRVQVNEKFFRPCEVNELCGDCTKLRNALGWEPRYKFKDLVIDMMGES